MKTSQLAKIIAHNVGQNGGDSRNFNGETPTSGFMVSRPGFEMRLDMELWGPVCREKVIKGFLKATQSIVEATGGYIGAWVDGQYLYLDLSVNYQDKEVALEVGRRCKQLAIYDVENGVSINC